MRFYPAPESIAFASLEGWEMLHNRPVLALHGCTFAEYREIGPRTARLCRVGGSTRALQ
jgi:hypothetical protein